MLLVGLVQEEVKEYLLQVKDAFRLQTEILKEEEAQQIVQVLIPEIDNIVAKKVKAHFIELANFINKKFT